MAVTITTAAISTKLGVRCKRMAVSFHQLQACLLRPLEPIVLLHRFAKIAMSIYYLSNDLLFASRVSGVAQQMGLSIHMITSVDALLTEANSTECRLVLLDLSLPNLELPAAIQRIKTQFPTVPCVAYGPHVHESRLQLASEAGCDFVLSRGQFNQQIASLLQLAIQ
jgi:DNA-binding NarL/FixJ family response regulator